MKISSYRAGFTNWPQRKTPIYQCKKPRGATESYRLRIGIGNALTQNSKTRCVVPLFAEPDAFNFQLGRDLQSTRCELDEKIRVSSNKISEQKATIEILKNETALQDKKIEELSNKLNRQDDKNASLKSQQEWLDKAVLSILFFIFLVSAIAITEPSRNLSFSKLEDKIELVNTDTSEKLRSLADKVDRRSKETFEQLGTLGDKIDKKAGIFLK